MYTQCPDCATVFRVTADALRSAQGDVRCGVCSTSFNALDNLSEEPFQPTPGTEAPASPEDTITVEETPGTEVIELSTPGEPPAASETPVSDVAEEMAMEFDADAEELDRLFVQMPGADLQRITVSAQAAARLSGAPDDPGAIAASLSSGGQTGVAREARNDDEFNSGLARTDEYPIVVLEEADELEAPARAPDRAAPPRPNPFETPRILIPEEMRKELRDEAAVDAAAALAFEEPGPEEGARRWPPRLALTLLALLLVAQIVHSQHDGLLRRPVVGPVLARFYSLIGSPIAAPTDLAAYELRQWGAATDAAQTGRLLLRASIVNRATYAQPYPLLRLALQDRFGTTVGMRDVEPVDYLPGAGAASLLAPGQRADAEIRIVDPGKDAVGFVMDVCLSSGSGVRCANETAPAAP